MINHTDLPLKLEDLPNIGGTLACLLRVSGINTTDELYETGAIQAFIMIREVDSSVCFSKLCALESAVKGIRWHSLTKDKKEELKHFFTMLKIWIIAEYQAFSNSVLIFKPQWKKLWDF